MLHLHEIFEELKNLELCGSQSEFSTKWLGRSKHYYAQLKTGRFRISMTSLHLLLANLELQALEFDGRKAHKRRVRALCNRTRTMRDGEYELRNIPPHYWVTAL